jgi:hypothetical protein
MAATRRRRALSPRLTLKVSGREIRPGRIPISDLLTVFPHDPLPTDAGSFFRGWSLDQLARLQGVDPGTDPLVLAGGWPDDDDVDEALADIYGQRE